MAHTDWTIYCSIHLEMLLCIVVVKGVRIGDAFCDCLC